MRIRSAVFTAVLSMLAAGARAEVLECGTSAETDLRIAALHARPRERVRIAATAGAAPARINGAFYLQANERVAPGYRPFDLEGQSLVFTPREGGRYAMSREPLRYVEPTSERNLVTRPTSADLGFTFSAFGRSVQRVWISPYLGITFDEEELVDDPATGFTELETLLRPQPLIAPLMQTGISLRALPWVYVDRKPSALIVTWRSLDDKWFGYDVQAELRKDGTIVYSYKSIRNMRWGTPVLAAGTNAANLARRPLFNEDVAPGLTAGTIEPPLRDMLDLRRVEVFRVAESEIISMRMTLAAAIDRTKLQPTQTLVYEFIIGDEHATVFVKRDSIEVAPFNTFQRVENGITGRVSGNTVEIFGLQRAPGTPRDALLNAVTFFGDSRRPADVLLSNVSLDAAPNRLAIDLSAASNSELPLPIFEPFLVPALDPFAVWDDLKSAYGFTDEEIDGVAIYQTFFTDLIFFATAYATGGNPQVEGIHPNTAGRGAGLPRMPTLMHLNQLHFDENADDRMSSVIMLHEFGHRWLYKLQFADGASKNGILSPQSFHPAAYVDTRSAFALYGDQESSVMGGGYFSSIGSGRWRARAQQYGYSWTDLYLMGLAAPDEVPGWFYLDGTSLPKSYFPTDGIEVTASKRDVALQQVIDALGPRDPAPAVSQRTFRVLFVLVGDPGKEPEAEDIATIDRLREKMEHDFWITTGGRGRVNTGRSVPKRRRAVH